ncbi:SMAD/FHA domain-containing protein, partial [Ramicandelaber brevisporus]
PHIRIAPHIVDVRNSLYFEAIDRYVPDGKVLKVGRFTDRGSAQQDRIAFRSKVVSRSHAEIWTESGNFYIKDTKSSSGTFLNNIRLSPAGTESRNHLLKDGDILQLGMDYLGGTQEIFKCVRIRIELNRTWQQNSANPFRKNVLNNIKKMAALTTACCICLFQMRPFQALFVSPCSHMFHFKCIKPIVFTSTCFSCPLCRTYADLEADVMIDDD